MNKNILIVSLLIVSLVLMGLLMDTCNSNKNLKEINASLNDTLVKTVDKLGRETATISNLEVENERMLMDLEIKDTILVWMREVVRDYSGKLQAAIVLSNRTNSTGSTRTIVEYKTDSAYPDYTTSWVNQWEEGKIVASRDSIFREIRIKNDYEITIGDRKNPWFKPKQSTVSIRNLNPNTLTQELRSVTIQERPKRLSLGLQVGYGLNSSGISPYVGVGLNYNVLSLK